MGYKRAMPHNQTDPHRLPPLIGWRERVRLPELGIGPIIAKIDTGARTAALHAEDIRIEGRGRRKQVRFKVPVNGRTHHCVLPYRGEKRIKSTSGHSQTRVVVETIIRIGTADIRAEVTLTDRADMGVPMLLGRATVRGHFVVHPGRSYIISRITKKKRP
jgi:hypothetical protein